MKTIKPSTRRDEKTAATAKSCVPIFDEPRTVFEDQLPESVKIVPTIYPTSKRLEESLEGFWETGEAFEEIDISVVPPESPLAVLEALGPSPFPKGGFPMVGFLATTYEKVGRYALERGSA